MVEISMCCARLVSQLFISITFPIIASRIYDTPHVSAVDIFIDRKTKEKVDLDSVTAKVWWLASARARTQQGTRYEEHSTIAIDWCPKMNMIFIFAFLYIQ